MNKRHNINTIAEVLIDKINEMDNTVARIEKVAKTPFKVDFSEIKSLLDKHQEKIIEENKKSEEILDDLKAFQVANKTRIPNAILWLLFVFFSISIASTFYAYKKVEAVEMLEAQNKYYLKKINELEK